MRKWLEKCEYGLLGEIENKLSSGYNIPTMFLIIAIYIIFVPHGVVRSLSILMKKRKS